MNKITLTAGGPRTRVQLAEAKQILKRFQKTMRQHGDDVQVHTLNLSCRQWPLESLQVLSPVLEKIAAQVVILKIDDIIAGLETDDGLASLTFLATMFSNSTTSDNKSSCMQEIDLSDNALGTRGAVVLKPLLQLQSLQRLYFNNCGLSAESFSETLLPILQMNAPQLTALGIGRNQLGPAGAAHIGQLLQNCVKLESFSYAGSRPQVEGTRDLCQGLAAMTVAATAASNSTTPVCSLQILDLDDCTFRSGDEAEDPCVALCQCLQASPALRKLVLRDGELQVTGLQRVLDSVQQAGARLQVLDLGATGTMGEEGAAVLRAYLQGTSAKAGAARHLQELSFDTNELTDAGLSSLVAPFTARECCLRKLNLAESELEAAGVRLLLDNPIPTLQELNLTDNPDIPLQLAVQLKAMYPVVLVEDDLEEGEDDDEDEEEDVDAIADQLAGTKL
jgi:Ran GTPase-activating protein (RanGAP) involved in mRNA processing and transport